MERVSCAGRARVARIAMRASRAPRASASARAASAAPGRRPRGNRDPRDLIRATTWSSSSRPRTTSSSSFRAFPRDDAAETPPSPATTTDALTFEETPTEEKDEKPAEKMEPYAAPAGPAIVGELRARHVIKETMRMASRDFFPIAMLICVAGAAAQALNLGGTFVLAILRIHDVEIVAAVFLAIVQFFKLSCENAAKVAVMRNARDVDAGVAARWNAFNPKNAWTAVVNSHKSWNDVLAVDARRVLSIAWNSLITIPIPYLGVMKLCDYAVCVPVYVFEGYVGGACLRRSMELMNGHRLTLLRAAFGLMGILSACVGVVVGIFMAICPTLPELLMPATDPAAAAAAAAAGAVGEDAAAAAAAAATASYGDAARGIFSGSAFDRVWDVGNTTEILSTIALLCCAVIGSFAFTTTLRQLIYVMHRETVARWTPPPPPPPEDPDAAKKGIGGMLRKLQFWRKDEGGDAEEKPPTPTPAAN